MSLLRAAVALRLEAARQPSAVAGSKSGSNLVPEASRPVVTESTTLAQLKEMVTLIAVHSRRTDMAPGGSSSGLAGCLPDAAWYHEAFEHIRARFSGGGGKGEGSGDGAGSKPLVFVVASDDISWFETNVLRGTPGVTRNSTRDGSVAIRGDVVLLRPRPLPRSINPKNGKLVCTRFAALVSVICETDELKVVT